MLVVWHTGSVGGAVALPLTYGGTDVSSYSDKNGRDKEQRKDRKVASQHDAAFRGYVNVQLTEDQKAAYVPWSESASLWEVLEASVSDGVQFSLKLDPKGHGYLAAATQRRNSSPNAGLVVTARGSSAGTAWGRLLFILAYLGHTERWEQTQPVSDPDRW